MSFYDEVIDSNGSRPIVSLVFALVFEFKENCVSLNHKGGRDTALKAKAQ